MAFSDPVIDHINNYITNDLPEGDWHIDYFSFIDDEDLRERLGVEYKNARYLYKIFEGLQATSDMRVAQVRTQIHMYSSIYEACVHHILFEYFKDLSAVQELIYRPTTVQASIPTHSLTKLKNVLSHNGEDVYPYYIRKKKRDITKIRFDEKCKVFEELGLIDEVLRDEIIEFYNMRNCIHIHAEIRKGLKYELDQSKKAYLRMKPFKDQVEEGLNRLGKNPATIL